ncbi:hypothetical protein [Kamptonema formosum]|uniref:hypothetical protein n=1 Tax=Kamptonema formosum TaxID=331992 RepID=UPI00034CAE35|nr:hypothetical protein [Oscillatoria sp. PCC 10802]
MWQAEALIVTYNSSGRREGGEIISPLEEIPVFLTERNIRKAALDRGGILW